MNEKILCSQSLISGAMSCLMLSVDFFAVYVLHCLNAIVPAAPVMGVDEASDVVPEVVVPEGVGPFVRREVLGEVDSLGATQGSRRYQHHRVKHEEDDGVDRASEEGQHLEEEEEKEVQTIAPPDAAGHPRAVVVKDFNTLVANRAVLRAWRFDDVARAT